MILTKQDLGVSGLTSFTILGGALDTSSGLETQSFQGPNVKQPGLASWATNKYKTEKVINSTCCLLAVMKVL